MDQNKFDTMMENWLARQRQQASPRSREVLWAVNAGITDGTAGSAFVTRDEVLRLLHGGLHHFLSQLVAVLREPHSS